MTGSGAGRPARPATDQWTDVPGMMIPAEVGKGTPSYGALFVATFTAEILAKKDDWGGITQFDILFGGQPGHPQSDNHRTFAAMPGEWRSVTVVRAFHFDDDVVRRDATVKVQVKRQNGVDFGIQNFLLKVERYPVTTGGDTVL
ncbi:hypothetical protein [Streptomyces sp. NPDC048172]|uniref:hypothetical protein n=1 Tax=Streptomyces sp. NPDC048172 TaxID=3365505 RepID=UPI003715904D